MFMPCPDSSTPAESAIVAFCVALNAPIVNIDALEVGPARAGILIAAGENGELDLLIRVSLLSTGDGITFEFQGDSAEFRDSSAAMAAGLSFSEGMGFLFDEDLLSQGGRSGRQRAIKIWTSLCGSRQTSNAEVNACEPAQFAAPPAPQEGMSEIELSDAPAEALPKDPARAIASTLLTKFREGALSAFNSSLADVRSRQHERLPDSLEKFATEALEPQRRIASEWPMRHIFDVSGWLTRLLSRF